MGYTLPDVNLNLLASALGAELVPSGPGLPNAGPVILRNEFRFTNMLGALSIAFNFALTVGPGTNQPHFLSSQELADLPGAMLDWASLAADITNFDSNKNEIIVDAAPVVRKLVLAAPTNLGGGPTSWLSTWKPVANPVPYGPDFISGMLKQLLSKS